MTKNSDSYARNPKKIDIHILESLTKKLKSERDKQIFTELLETTAKTAALATKFSLSKRRLQQIVSTQTKEYLGIKLLPKDIRKLAIAHQHSQGLKTKEISKKAGIKIRQKKVLSKDQIKSLRSVAKNKNHLLILDTLLETGCTLTEFTNIKRVDVSEESINIDGRKIKISKDLSERLREEKSEYVFSTRQSSKISDKRVFQILKKLSKAAGIEGLSPQVLRNTKTLGMASKGFSAKEIQKQTGIKNTGINHLGLGEALHD